MTEKMNLGGLSKMAGIMAFCATSKTTMSGAYHLRDL